jgi:trehalose 6-phosphate synthase/phosphatase
MSKLIIVSNRLPLNISVENDELTVSHSSGGLATGMSSIHNQGGSLWVGWSGIEEEKLDLPLKKKIHNELANEKCASVGLTKNEVDEFYYGLSNKALWPLFHYFTEFSRFDNSQWESYKKVNQKFADIVISNLSDGDRVWIHDYQLMLLPSMIRKMKPNVTIGFFLHIPFPSFEIFRIFPWREELLNGVLGSDLIGFHTYDYERHFMSSVKRLLRLNVNFNQIEQNDRRIIVDTFPMGIDYDKFWNAAQNHHRLKNNQVSDLQKQLNLHIDSSPSNKLILSIDRLDYTKGVVNRIKAFEVFLEMYPQYKEKVRLVMLAVPSRSDVPQYKKLKRQTDEIVGRVNGKLSTVNWTPIWYFYRSMSFENLIDLYTSSDIAMITPVRDGMNLVAKEYISTRIAKKGVLILSEMAGASQEMNEAILVNPSDLNALANSIKKAVEMPAEEQAKRNNVLQKRLKRYNVHKWANDFMGSLLKTEVQVESIKSTIIGVQEKKEVISSFKSANNRLLFFDYDGTLVDFNNNPDLAIPSKEILKSLEIISMIPNTHVVINSGRDKAFLEKHFGNYNISLIAEHGYKYKLRDEAEWSKNGIVKSEWMNHVLPLLEGFIDRTPGSFIEQKEASIAWHYRKSPPELAEKRVVELNILLSSLISDGLHILNGNKVIEVKNSRINKGFAANKMVEKKHDFIFAIGDDTTDEYLFEELPERSFTIKVGPQNTVAKFTLANIKKVHELIKNFI